MYIHMYIYDGSGDGGVDVADGCVEIRLSVWCQARWCPTVSSLLGRTKMGGGGKCSKPTVIHFPKFLSMFTSKLQTNVPNKKANFYIGDIE